MTDGSPPAGQGDRADHRHALEKGFTQKTGLAEPGAVMVLRNYRGSQAGRAQSGPQGGIPNPAFSRSGDSGIVPGRPDRRGGTHAGQHLCGYGGQSGVLLAAADRDPLRACGIFARHGAAGHVAWPVRRER